MACYFNALFSLARKYAVLDAAQVRPAGLELQRDERDIAHINKSAFQTGTGTGKSWVYCVCFFPSGNFIENIYYTKFTSSAEAKVNKLNSSVLLCLSGYTLINTQQVTA